MAFDGLLGGRIGYWLLRRLVRKPSGPEPTVEIPRSDWDTKLGLAFGPTFRSTIKDKVVLDYGCGYGEAALSMAKMGARRVIGLDINDQMLAHGRRRVIEAPTDSECIFLNAHDDRSLESLYGTIDVVTSYDAFEHYADPRLELSRMRKLLSPGGSLFVSFGPPWWHPYGCHMMFMGAPPWVHVLFQEQTIMAVRGLYRSDGATQFEDVEGGLNRMTIRRFEELVRASDLEVLMLRCVPIRGTEFLSKIGWGRECFTSVVRAHLIKRDHHVTEDTFFEE
jgi:ubiquinone/menaquinone biosynthesis C-methylase UbiE